MAEAMKRPARILVTCGESSGDLHASSLVRELLRKQPEARILALGGDRVLTAGAELISHIRDVSIIGISGVVTQFGKLAKLERKLKRVIDDGIDLFIPVDYPGLNLRLAEYAKKRGVPVLYYISPQVWAWGRGRIRKLQQFVDYLAVILPFEEDLYRDEGIRAEFVGHPILEDHGFPEAMDQSTRSGIGLLPGSRTSEVRRILPVLLETAERIRDELPGERFAIGMSKSVPRRIYEKIVGRHNVEVELTEDTHELMASSRLLLVASGTATLQGALYETPLIIVYRVSMVNYLAAKLLVKIEHIGLVNIILGEEICPEFVQVNARPDRIADEALKLLGDRGARNSMVNRFGTLRSMLGGKGGSRRVAEISEQLLHSR